MANLSFSIKRISNNNIPITPTYSTSYNSLSFNGSTQYVIAKNTLSYKYTTSVTLEAWIKVPLSGSPGSDGGWSGIINKESLNQMTDGGSYGLELLNNQLAVYDWTNNSTSSVTTQSLNDDSWHHVAFSCNSGVANGSSLYIDGFKKLTFTYTIKNLSNAYLMFGINYGSIQKFTGKIANVRIWDTNLSESFISTYYNKQITSDNPYYANLTGWYAMGEGSGKVINNYSPNKLYALDLINAPTWLSSDIPIIFPNNFVINFVGVINGNFTADKPTIGVSQFPDATGYIKSTTTIPPAFAWTTTAETSNGHYLNVALISSYSLPALTGYTKALTIQSYTTIPYYIYQSIYFPVGSYVLTFYAIGRPGIYYNTNTKFSVSIGNINFENINSITSSAWSRYDLNFNITSSNTQILMFNYAGVTTDNMILLTGISINRITSYILNGGFTSPEVPTYSLYSNSPYNQITNWTYSLGSNNLSSTSLLSKFGYFTNVSLPSRYNQYVGLQNQLSTTTLPNNMSLNQPIRILNGNYLLSFYMIARADEVNPIALATSNWTSNSGVTTSNTIGNPAPSIQATVTYSYAYINATTVIPTLTTFWGKIINIDMYCTSNSLVDFFFACNSSGIGNMFRLDVRNNFVSGISTTNNWTSWQNPSGVANLVSDTWYNFIITINSSGIATFKYKKKTDSIYTDCVTTFSITNSQTYIGVQADGGTGGYIDNIYISNNTDTVLINYSNSTITSYPIISYYESTTTVNVYISTSTTLNNGLPTTGTYYLIASGLLASKTAWELKNIYFTVPISGTYYLFIVLTKNNNTTSFSTVLFTGVNLKLISNLTTATTSIPSFKSLYFNDLGYANTSTVNYYGNAEFTAECWIKVPITNNPSATSYQGIMVKNGIWGLFLKGNYLNSFNWGSTGTADNIYSGKLMNDGLWHHVALVFSPSVTNGSKIFLDGSMVLQFTMSFNPFASETMVSIGSAGGIKQYFNGQISYVRIWNTLKTDYFISSNYNKYLIPASYSDLIASYYFQEGTGTTITNNSTVSPYNTYSLTLTNTFWSTESPPIIGFLENTEIINNLIPGVTPWGIYDATLWNSTTKVLPEARGNGRDVSGNASGTFTYSIGSGNWHIGNASIPQISGGTASILTWPAGSWPTSFTICGIVRYTSTTATSRKRLFTTTSANNNLLGSFDNTAYAYAYWDALPRSTSQANTTSINWLVCCGKNTPNTTAGTALNTVLMNGLSVGTTTGGNGGGQITLNGWGGNESEWAFSYLVIYDSVLTDAQMTIVSTKLQNYLNVGSMNIPTSLYSTIPTGIYSSIPSGCRGLYACKWVNTNYTGPIFKLRKSSDTTGTSPQNFYMDKTGTVVTTLPNGTGTTFATWLGADIAYVNVWYDQSLGAKDAIQTFTASQPFFTLTNGVDLSGSRFLVLPNTMLTTGGTTYTISYKVKNATNIQDIGAVFMYGQHATNELVLYFSGTTSKTINNGRWGSTYASYAIGTVPNNLVVTNKYGSNTLTLYNNGLSVATAASTFTIANGTSVTTATTDSGSGESNTIGTGRNETFIRNFGGSLDFFFIFDTALSDTERIFMESIGENIVNGNFSQSITGTSQIVTNETPVNSWTLSPVDNNNVTFLIASTTDTTYTSGTSTTYPFVALPTSIPQFLVSKLATAGYSQTITQPININSTGIYSLSFNHAGRATTNSYTSNHTLTVKIGSKTILTDLSSSIIGWQLYTGLITILSSDIGTKDLTFTFSNSLTYNSSFYLSGINFNYYYLNVSASGNVLTSGNVYIFTGNGTLSLKNVNVQILAVGGGGGGGWGNGSTGGGGGGGVVDLKRSITTQSVLTITIGSGGSAGSSGTNTTCVFTSGYSSIIAGGGGTGGTNGSSSGGSGGGAGRVGLSTPGGTGNNSNSNYANNGGKSSSIQGWAGAGGGGGAGGVGEDGFSNNSIVDEKGGNGGIGYLSDITGQSLYWAGGGGAGNQETTSTPGKGGLGGGGAGLAKTNYLSSNNGLSGYTVGSNGNAGVNTGGGGGGAQSSGYGNGGSGIFIVKIL